MPHLFHPARGRLDSGDVRTEPNNRPLRFLMDILHDVDPAAPLLTIELVGANLIDPNPFNAPTIEYDQPLHSFFDKWGDHHFLPTA
jgi:hypothetical protein